MGNKFRMFYGQTFNGSFGQVTDKRVQPPGMIQVAVGKDQKIQTGEILSQFFGIF